MNIQEDPNYLSENSQGDKLVIYQLLPRLFTNTKTTNKIWGSFAENGCGKMNEINGTALKALKDFGVTHVWYTGIIEHATMSDFQEFGLPLDEPEMIKGRAGSPYAIKDYYDVHPAIAEDVLNRMAEFEALVERTQKQGMKVLIDFVPNHVARGYISDQKVEGAVDFGVDDDTSLAFSPKNNFYYLPNEALQLPEVPALTNLDLPRPDEMLGENPAKASGNDVFSASPSVNDWYETIKLNYGVDYLNDHQSYFDPIPDTWLKMKHILQYWAKKGVDGFRCDMVFMVPIPFWNWVIGELKEEFPHLIFIAEIYNEHQYREFIEEGRFDYLYDKVQLYDTLKKIVRQNGSTHWLTGIWQNLKGINKNMLRFLENHDEQRIPSPDFAKQAEFAKPAMFISTCWHTGPVMVYFGQEVGEPGFGESGFSSNDGRTTIFDYWGVPEHQKWLNNGQFDGGQLTYAQKELRQYYQQLLHLSQEEAIAEGDFYDLQPSNLQREGYNDKVYSFLRFTEKQCLLFVCNFNIYHSAHFNLWIPEHVLENLGVTAQSKWQGFFGITEQKEYDQGMWMNLPSLATFVYQLEK